MGAGQPVDGIGEYAGYAAVVLRGCDHEQVGEFHRSTKLLDNGWKAGGLEVGVEVGQPRQVVPDFHQIVGERVNEQVAEPGVERGAAG